MAGAGDAAAGPGAWAAAGRESVNARTKTPTEQNQQGRGIVVSGMSAGTASEAALALRAGKPLVLVAPADGTISFLRALRRGEPIAAPDAEAAIAALRRLLQPS